MNDKSHDVSTMKQAEDRLNYSYDLLSDIKKQLETARGNMMTKWGGDAATAFSNVVIKFNGNLQSILDAQQQLADNLGMAKMQHENTEQQQQEMVNVFEGLLNK